VIRSIAALLTALVLPALAGAGMPTWQQLPSTNKPRKQVTVQFTDSTLHPSIAQVVENGTVSWLNYATDYLGTIVFSDAVASAFTCSDLGPDFMKRDQGYQSIPIRGEPDELEIPCPLKPGEYEYEVWLFSGFLGDPADEMDEPESRMQGKIIVE